MDCHKGGVETVKYIAKLPHSIYIYIFVYDVCVDKVVRRFLEFIWVYCLLQGFFWLRGFVKYSTSAAE